MFEPGIVSILNDASKITQATGRRLKSSKNDIDDLRTLQSTLRLIANGLDPIIETIKLQQT